MTPREILMIPMRGNDAGALTVGGYLQALLERVWEEEEGFSGKRPFGNSGWQHEVHAALIKAGAATGTIDSEGYVSNKGNADQVVFDAIEALFSEPRAILEANTIAAMALRREADRLEPEPDEK